MKRFLAVAIAFLMSTAALASADLVVVNAKPDKTAVPVGENLKITFDLKNNGTSAASPPAVKITLSAGTTYVTSTGPYPVSQSGSDVIFASPAGSSLNGGAFVTHSVTVKAPSTAGPMAFWIEADPNKLVTESNETNNKASVGNQSFHPPSIAAKRGACPTASQPAGGTNAFSLALNNIGQSTVRYASMVLSVGAGGKTFQIMNSAPAITGIPTGNITSWTHTHYPGLVDPGTMKSVTLWVKVTGGATTVTGTVKVANDSDAISTDNEASCSYAVH